jgi:NAD(P)-dependent dehydrogenase (short-subunit alcohol dehydrogenase family)
MDYEAWGQVLCTNTMSPFRVTAAFLPHLLNSEKKIVATISSRLGSMSENQEGRRYIYRSSKAALNAVMKGLAIDLADDGIRVVLLHPGWVSTDLGGPNAPVKAGESVTGMRRVIGGLKDGETGIFIDYNGNELTW